MSSFISTDLILVTGGNGYVAQHVVDQLLRQQGQPRVRATVRSEASAKQIKDYFAPDLSSGRLSVVLVPDIVAEGAFDEALKGVTHVAHVASPLALGIDNVEADLLKPAIEGTVGIIRAAVKFPSVRSMVITGSFLSAFDPAHSLRPGYTYTPDDWNPISYSEASSQELDLTQWEPIWRPLITYMASKKLAEEAVWKARDAIKPRFDISVVLPAYIGGPSVLPLQRGTQSGSLSVQVLWKAVTEECLPPVDYPYWVDVRDVAKVHVQALLHPEADGKRFILATRGVTYSDIAEIARKHFPQLQPSTEQQSDVQYYQVDSSKSLRILNLGPWIPVEKMVVDTISQLLDTRDTN
ncbi:hypothetical protein N7471_013756 [Penicillium samsonianum]|uniref:uncharacterized protein n=1 Tax=Penicillium samsonianum TaxID=1882272 RepID=UPI0025465BE2|nr:uncharacterized protein N7471_013756 [Penicillium samsonianum]KAJ6118289.1 hypothetical protein N7471_013756 [Penicillium samsonianum]